MGASLDCRMDTTDKNVKNASDQTEITDKWNNILCINGDTHVNAVYPLETVVGHIVSLLWAFVNP